MAKSPKTKRKKPPKTVLKLPDLEQSKSAVLNSLASASSQRLRTSALWMQSRTPLAVAFRQ